MTIHKKRTAAPTVEAIASLADIPDQVLLAEVARRLNASSLPEMLVREAFWNHLQPTQRDLKIAAKDAGGTFHSEDEWDKAMSEAVDAAIREDPLTREAARMAYGVDEFNASTLRGLLADRGIFHAYS